MRRAAVLACLLAACASPKGLTRETRAAACAMPGGAGIALEISGGLTVGASVVGAAVLASYDAPAAAAIGGAVAGGALFVAGRVMHGAAVRCLSDIDAELFPTVTATRTTTRTATPAAALVGRCAPNCAASEKRCGGLCVRWGNECPADAETRCER